METEPIKCNYVFKSGKNKGNTCGKTKCNKHGEDKKTVKRSVKKTVKEKPAVAEEAGKDMDMKFYLKLLYKEFQFIKDNNILVKTININQKDGEETEVMENIKSEITFEHVANYCFHRYRFFKSEKSINDFTKIYHPIHPYTFIDEKLEKYNDMELISLIHTIKYMDF